MKNLLLLVFFILGLVVLQLAEGQTVDDILEKYATARGGKDKLNAIQSIYMEGSREIPGGELIVKITKVAGKLSRTDFEVAGQTGYTIVTSTEGWTFIPMRSTSPEAVTPDRLKIMQSDLDIVGPLVDYVSKGHKAELQGKEAIDGNDCYKIKITLNTGRDITYYIDAKTYMLVRSSTIAPTMGRDAKPGEVKEAITTFSDYRDVDGLKFPFSIGSPAGGQGGGTLNIEKIELNKPVDATLYKPSK